MADLFDGGLENAGVLEHQSKNTTNDSKCLTDGRNFLWVFGDDEGRVSTFTNYGFNDATRILVAIAKQFGVDLASEYDPQYWGYETREEWDAAWTEIAENEERDFYNEVAKLVRGENHSIQPGTIGIIKAEIAKRLIAESPDLLAEDKRSELIKAVKGQRSELIKAVNGQLVATDDIVTPPWSN